MKKILSAVLVFVFVLCSVMPAFAAPYTAEVFAESVLLVDVDTGEILYAKNDTKQMYPAGTTKLMTALVAYELCPDIDESFVIEADALNGITYGSDRTLEPMLSSGETVTMREIIGGILLGAGNDAASVAAYHCSGSVSDFVEAMNAKAISLGMSDTHFTNPHGKTEEEHYTTAADMVKLMKAIYKTPELLQILNLESITFTGENAKERVVKSANMFYFGNDTQKYSYGTGGLSGFTNSAQGCLAVGAEKDGLRFVCIVLGEPTEDGMWLTAKGLFEYAFNLTVTYSAAELFKDIQLPETGERVVLTPDFSGIDVTVSKYFDLSAPTVSFTLPEDKEITEADAEYYAKDGTLLARVPVKIEYMKPVLIVRILKVVLIIVVILIILLVIAIIVLKILHIRYEKEKARRRAIKEAQRAQMMEQQQENVDYSDFK